MRIASATLNFDGWDSGMIRVNGLGVSMATGKLEWFKASNRSSTRATSNSFWRIAALTAAGAIGVASQAKATIYWPQPDLEFSQPAPEIVAPPQKRRVRDHSEGRSRRGQKEIEAQGK